MTNKEEALQDMQSHAMEDAIEAKREMYRDEVDEVEEDNTRLEEVYDNSYEPTCGTPEPNFM